MPEEDADIMKMAELICKSIYARGGFLEVKKQAIKQKLGTSKGELTRWKG